MNFLAISLFAALGFLWPFIFSTSIGWYAYLLGPIAIALIALEFYRRRFDSRTIALLAVLAATMAALRPLGAGFAGIEPMWFILIIGAAIFGTTFGFLLGTFGIIASAFITSGIGPWLAYQTLAAAWIGALAGFVGYRARAFSAIFGALLFGLLMDLQFWPIALGSQTQLSYSSDLSVGENIHRFIIFHFTTSMAWDIPRAIVTTVLVLTLGAPLSKALLRAKKKMRVSERVMEQRAG